MKNINIALFKRLFSEKKSNCLTKIFFLVLAMYLSATSYSQYNYFNFNNGILANPAFTSTGNGMVLTGGGELFYRSAYSYMGVARSWDNWSEVIVWSAVPVKTTSEIVSGDNKVFYVDGNNRLRLLYWDQDASTWRNWELNINSPAARGEGLVFVGNSTLYYTTTTGSICRVYNVGYPSYAWNYEIITSVPGAKTGSRLTFGDGKLFYADINNKFRELYFAWGSWQTTTLNSNLPDCRGDGLVFGTNSNIFYTSMSGYICNVFYSGGWDFTEVTSCEIVKTGSKLLCDNNIIYYVGQSGYLYSLMKDNCDWFNKKINQSAQPKPEAIYWGVDQIFYRKNSDNVIYNSRTQTSIFQPYVYIKGKTFYDKASPFYPVVMNYQIDFVDNWPTFWGVEPHAHYNNLETYDDQAAAWAAMGAHFTDLVSKGFNTIRLMGLDACHYFTPDPDNPSEPDPNDPNNFNATIVIRALWNRNFLLPSSTVQNDIIPRIKDILDLADQKGLKVILCLGNGATMTPNYYTNYINQYVSLIASSSLLKTHPALLAYDINNEPGLSFSGDKPHACNATKAAYDAIRGVNGSNDNNHLITIGTFGVTDLMQYDPGILSCDFYSFHYYVQQIPGIWNVQVKRTIKWNQKHLNDRPWIIGETSASAFEKWDSNNDNCLNSNFNTLGSYGAVSENEQAKYADSTQYWTKTSGGSGYSWWQYHDVKWGSIYENYYGIYSFCHRDKPVAHRFDKNFLDQQQFPCSEIPLGNDDFYGYSANHTYSVTGTLYDSNQIPIAGGFIHGSDASGKYYYTFSKHDGTFVLSSAQALTHADVTALGKEIKTNNNPTYTFSVPYISNLNSITLNSVICGTSGYRFTGSPITGAEKARAFEVFPNPTNGILNITADEENNYTLNIYNVIGQLILQHEFTGSNVSINLNDQTGGMYFVELTNKSTLSSFTSKILLQK